MWYEWDMITFLKIIGLIIFVGLLTWVATSLIGVFGWIIGLIIFFILLNAIG